MSLRKSLRKSIGKAFSPRKSKRQKKDKGEQPIPEEAEEDDDGQEYKAFSSPAPAPAPNPFLGRGGARGESFGYDTYLDNNDDDGTEFTDESGQKSITLPRPPKTFTPSPPAAVAAKKKEPTKPNPFQRVPNWLVDDEWDSVVFQTLITKVYFTRAPERVRSASRVASTYAGKENRYLANLTHEFDLSEDDWEAIMKTVLPDDLEMEAPPPSSPDPEPERKLLEPDSDEDSVPYSPRPSSVEDIVYNPGSSGIKPQSPPTSDLSVSDDGSAIPSEVNPNADHPLDKFVEMKSPTTNNASYFVNQRTRRATWNDPKPKQEKRLGAIMQHFKDRQRKDEIKERLMNPGKKLPSQAPPVVVSSSAKLPQKLTPSKPNAEKAFYTTAPFLNQPTPEQQKQMSNFSPTTDQLFAKLNSKVSNISVDPASANESYYGESDDKYYREWTEKQQEQIDRQREEAEFKYQQELKEFEAQKKEWEAQAAKKAQQAAGRHTRNSVIIKGAETSEELRDRLLEEVVIKPTEEKHNARIREDKAKDEDRIFDDSTMKLILSTFYAVHKPEKLGIVNSIVENWSGAKSMILVTLEEKYGVDKATWKDIVKGSWISNTGTKAGTLEEANKKEIDNLIEQYKHHHFKEEKGNHNTFESTHQADIVDQHVKDSIYKYEDSVIVAGSYQDPDTIDLVVHNMHYKVPEEDEEKNSTWEWAGKLKGKDRHYVHCRVTPILLNNSLLVKDMVETTAVELNIDKGRLSKNEHTGGMEKWTSISAKFDLVITIQNPRYANNAIYGLQVEVYEVTSSGTEVQLGYYHIPMEDMEGYQCFKKDEAMTLNRWLRQYDNEHEAVYVANAVQPMVGLTLCYRHGPAAHDNKLYLNHADSETPVIREKSKWYSGTIVKCNEGTVVPNSITQSHGFRKTAKETFRKMDEDGDGLLNAEELRKGLEAIAAEGFRTRALATFREMDKDGNGTLDAKELRIGLKAITGKSHSLKECKELIKTFDKDNNGLVDFEEFIKFLEPPEGTKTKRTTYTDEQCKSLIKRYDKDRNGLIDFDEFIMLIAELEVTSVNVNFNEATSAVRAKDFLRRAHQTFRGFDADGNGTLDAHELKEGLEAVTEKKYTLKQVQALIKEHDDDGNGVVSFDEFVNFLAPSEAASVADGVVRQDRNIELKNVKMVSRDFYDTTAEVEVPDRTSKSKIEVSMRVELNFVRGLDEGRKKKRGRIVRVNKSTEGKKGKKYSTHTTYDIKCDDNTTEERVPKEALCPLKKEKRRVGGLVDGTMNNYHPDKACALKHRNNPEILNGSRCEVYYPETKELPVAYHLYDEDVQVFPEDIKMFRLQRSFREMIIRRCTVEQDIEALEKGREEAKEEEKKLLDLVERMTKEPKEVAFAVAQYFNEMKKAESEIHSGVKDISKFKKEKVLRDDATFGSNFNSLGGSTRKSITGIRRKSPWFSDVYGNSMIPVAYVDSKLDIGTLQLLEMSVFDPRTGKVMPTVVPPRDAIKAVHTGAVKRGTLMSKAELKRTNLDGRRSEAAPTLTKVPDDPNVPSYQRPTIKAHQGLLEEKERLEGLKAKAKRLKGTGSGKALKEKREKEREEKRFKGFKRFTMGGAMNAKGGEI